MSEHAAPDDPATVARLYDFLAQCLEDPRGLQQATPPADPVAALEQLLDATGLDGPRDTLRAWRAAETDRLGSLVREHTRLFGAAEGAPRLPLRASHWAEAQDPRWDPANTRRFYRSHGYDLEAPSDAPDDLRRELQFMALLLREGKHEAEARFRKTHFRPWFVSFLEKAREEARHPFYQTTLGLVDLCTKEDE